MKPSIDKITQQLADLLDKTEKLDEALKDIRVKINDVLWDLMELKKGKEDNKSPIKQK